MRLSWFFRTTSTGSQAWGETENNFRAGWTICLSEGPQVEVSEAAKGSVAYDKIWKRSEHFPS
jgi:hypothetical protein